MAKKHKNLENIPIQWDGDLSHPEAGNQGQSIPASIDLGTWAGWGTDGYQPNYDCPMKQTSRTEAQCYYEDYDKDGSGNIQIPDVNQWNNLGAPLALGDSNTPLGYLLNVILGYSAEPPKASETGGKDQSKIFSNWNGSVPDTYTWGDVSFVIEIADGLGTGSRRAREARLQQLDKDKKKRLIRLICRVKGEKVYDEEKEVGDIQLKLDDVDMVINKVVGTMKVSTEWKEVPWDYGYDK